MSSIRDAIAGKARENASDPNAPPPPGGRWANRAKLAIVSFGFLGCSPFAPGTVGTLGGVLVAWLLSPLPYFPVWVAIACVALYAITLPLGPWSERYAGKKDPGIFVVDEVIGYLITVAWMKGPSPLALAVAFFVFRFFDILKPPPARQLEHVGGGHGILLDDVAAGFWGLLVVMLPARLLLPDLPWTL
ncbi:MAG: phosphatidylglycerophosphatase A [Planctomycetota bacterium]|nr:phosphatidylglycerophosphatase A [Planctomycetota bacterium]